MTKEQRYQYSEKHIRRMKLFERQHLKAVIVALHTQITPIVKKLRKEGIEAAQAAVNAEEINTHLVNPIKDIYKTVGLYFANKTIFDIKQSEKKGGFGFNEEFIRDILAYFARYFLGSAVLPISETTKNQILQVISDGLEKGYGADKIAMALESPELLLWRARLIVRTESNKAMNYGQLLGESKSEAESTKLWIAANDHRTRHSHRLMDDVRIDFNDKFMVPIYKSVGGVRGKSKGIEMQVGVDMMTGPGDLHASAGNVCNCRCTMSFAAKRDANGRIIMKKPNIFTPVLMKDIISPEIDYETKNSEVMDNAKGTAIMVAADNILEKVSKFEEKIDSFQPVFTDDVKSEMVLTRNHIELLVNEKSLAEEKSIDKLINLINSKEYSPEIKLQTDSEEVISEVNGMRYELVTLLTDLKHELTKKKTSKHTVERDANGLIKTITTVTL